MVFFRTAVSFFGVGHHFLRVALFHGWVVFWSWSPNFLGGLFGWSFFTGVSAFGVDRPLFWVALFNG